MTWRDREGFFSEDASGDLRLQESYQRAQFKDAPFWVTNTQEEVGRRQSVQRFPGNVYTNVQDLGAESARLTVQAYLVGDDYDSELLYLKGRLTEGGPGELRLPWMAPITVTIIGGVRVSNTQDQRGYATVTFDCVETGATPPRFSTDSAARMADSANAARSATRERFGKLYSTKGLTESRRESMRRSIKGASTAVVNIQKKVDAFVAEIAKDANAINTLSGTLNDLINTPLDLSDEIVNAVITAYSSLASTSDTVQNVVLTWGRGGPLRILADQVFRFNRDFRAESVEPNSAVGIQEQRNLNEWERLNRLNHFYEMARVLPNVPVESYQQAVGVRARFFDEIDELFRESEPAETRAIAALRESVGAWFEEIAKTLPSVASYTPAQTTTALLVAYRAYGSARGADDIIVRNSIRHPGFIPGGEPLEVLGE